LPLADTKGSEGEAGADLPHANGAGGEGEGEIAVRWLGGIFLLALIAIALAVYSDIAMTRCAAGSFFAVLGWCSTYR
jgi:hypothetical protein